MAVFNGEKTSTAVSWIAEQARMAVDVVRNRAERLYRHAQEAESLRQANEIILYGWSITLYSDGTALAENHLTGDMLELDAEQAAELKWAVKPESVERRQGPRA
jgi:hypothetical protein